MTRYFMRDTPLYQMEQMMMTPPHFKPRGHGLRRPTFHYQSEDVDCQYCTNYSKENPCPLCECTCLGERIETGSLSLAKVIEDCLRGKLRMRLWKRLAQEIYPYPLQAFHSDEHRSRWMHWRTRCRRLSQRNQAALFLLTAYDDTIVHQMIECVKVYPDGRLDIIFGGGYLIEEALNEENK